MEKNDEYMPLTLESEIQISIHAEDRLKERCGLGKSAIKRMVQKAYDEGIPHSKTKGKLNKWVTSLFFKNTNANNIRLYGDKAYIFCNKILVTVIQIPASLTKDLQKMLKQK